MVSRRILIIQGHPDASARHLCHALAEAYAEGALAGGHEVRTVDVARLDFPLLRSQHDWEHAPLPAGLQAAQADIAWAQHLVFFFPLWLGDMPALLKGFLEQVARPGFAFKAAAGAGDNPFSVKGLKGRSARVVVTMGMPALFYRWFFFAHSLRSLERNVLRFVGIAPVRQTLVGLADRLGAAGVRQWQDRLRACGRAAS
jgi:putative NADPH-quinone reductase